MRTSLRYAALGALALSCAFSPTARAFPANSANGFEIAEFGEIQIDDKRALPLQRFINRKALAEQLELASAKNTLDFRPDAPGLYRISFVSQGDARRGGVRVIVTIVGQNGLKAIRARGENVQTWGGYSAPGFEPYLNPYLNPLSVPRAGEDIRAYPYPLPDTTRPRRANGCAKDRGSKVSNDDDEADKKVDKKADKEADKKADKKVDKRADKAPDAAPESKKSAPPERPSTREEKTRPPREREPEPERALRPEDKEDRPGKRGPSPISRPDNSQPPKRDRDPSRDKQPDRPRYQAPDPSPESSRPAPNYSVPNPVPGTDNRPQYNGGGPNPQPEGNRAPTYTGNGPNPLPDRNAGRGPGDPNRPLPSSRPTYDGGWYGNVGPFTGPYYPGAYPGPYYPESATYPGPYVTPGTRSYQLADDATVRAAIELAILGARAQAEADFAKQVRGE